MTRSNGVMLDFFHHSPYYRGMPLNIKNRQVEDLVEEVARLASETKTEAVRKALEERRARLALRGGLEKGRRFREFLEREIWPRIPVAELGRRLSRREEDEILGYGKDGS